MQERIIYPFTAIVGQEDMKLALILNLINPALGDVLIRGEKGTAKSTAVRGLCNLLEQVEVVEGCAFHCRPGVPPLCEECAAKENPKTVSYTRKVVELPISATEDRVVGALNIEQAIKKGEKVFEPGILAEANGNILYVDEINLLADSMAASVVCAASAGENLVEREGISYRHDCSFILIGTMNPEEGGLRPQLLDKFGFYVNMDGEKELDTRMEILRRRLDYERDPRGFIGKYQEETQKLQKTVERAQVLLKESCIDENVRRVAAKVAAQALCEGNRAELLLIETASAIAALDGRKHVTVGDIREAAEYVLPHRRREASPEQEQPGEQQDKENNQEQNSEEPEQNPENDGDGQEEEQQEDPAPPQLEMQEDPDPQDGKYSTASAG